MKNKFLRFESTKTGTKLKKNKLFKKKDRILINDYLQKYNFNKFFESIEPFIVNYKEFVFLEIDYISIEELVNIFENNTSKIVEGRFSIKSDKENIYNSDIFNNIKI